MEAEAEGENNSLMSTITNRSLLSFKGPRGCTITFKFIRVDQCMHANRRLVHSSNRTVTLTIMETRVHKDEIWQAHCTWPRLTHRIRDFQAWIKQSNRRKKIMCGYLKLGQCRSILETKVYRKTSRLISNLGSFTGFLCACVRVLQSNLDPNYFSTILSDEAELKAGKRSSKAPTLLLWYKG